MNALSAAAVITTAPDAATILEGTLVRLEPLRLEHADELIEAAFDPAIWKWVPSGPVASDEQLRGYISIALAERDRRTAMPFAVIDRKSARAVGSTRYGTIDVTNRHVQIGWTWLGAKWQRSGINTEMKYLMLRHAFEVLGFVRVEFKADALNLKSRTAIERLGAKHEGTFRKHIVCHDGRIRDTAWYSILDDEWPAIKAALEARLLINRS